MTLTCSYGGVFAILGIRNLKTMTAEKHPHFFRGKSGKVVGFGESEVNREKSRLSEIVQRAKESIDKAVSYWRGRGATSEEAEKLVDGVVAEATSSVFENNNSTEDLRKEAWIAGVVEVSREGNQPETADAILVELKRNPEESGRMLHGISGYDGINTQELIREIDNVECAKEDVYQREKLKQSAVFCVWDQELQKPVLDHKYVEDRKRNTRFMAAEVVNGDWESCGDEEVIEAIDGCRINTGNAVSDLKQRERKLQERLSGAEYDEQKRKIEAVLDKTQKRIQEALQDNGTIDKNRAMEAVIAILDERLDYEATEAVKEMERAIKDRVEADKYPWTMPGFELVDRSVMENMKQHYETLIGRHNRNNKAPGDDKIRLGGAMLYDDGEVLLHDIGGNTMHSKSISGLTWLIAAYSLQILLAKASRQCLVHDCLGYRSTLLVRHY